jgi:NhaP-type Na+/H+ or K+/H+ antiporter
MLRARRDCVSPRRHRFKGCAGTVSLPRSVLALLEGESMLNDATGLVLYRFAVAAV